MCRAEYRAAHRSAEERYVGQARRCEAELGEPSDRVAKPRIRDRDQPDQQLGEVDVREQPPGRGVSGEQKQRRRPEQLPEPVYEPPAQALLATPSIHARTVLRARDGAVTQRLRISDVSLIAHDVSLAITFPQQYVRQMTRDQTRT